MDDDGEPGQTEADLKVNRLLLALDKAKTALGTINWKTFPGGDKIREAWVFVATVIEDERPK